MNIAIFAQNTTTKYSGGRYHSWLMAEALAQEEHNVFYITNSKPVFYHDFSNYLNHSRIKLWITPNFWFNLPKSKFDIVFLVPSLKKNPTFFLKVIYFAELRNARLILLNFETPNWFNALSPFKRNISRWNNWRLSSLRSFLVLSSSNEGNIYAKEFFKNCSANTIFDFCYPSINSIEAELIANIEKEKRILLITRFERATHKGGFDMTDLISDAMRDYTIVLIVGSGEVPPEVLNNLSKKANACGAKLKILYKLTDHEKFHEIKRASLMLFPSSFEGFGLPPVEALYCNTVCVAFDLPVLREVNGEGLIYVDPGNWSEFKSTIQKILSSDKDTGRLRDYIENTADFYSYAKRLDVIINRVANQAHPPEASYFRFCYFAMKSYIAFVPEKIKQFFLSLQKLVVALMFPLLVLLYFPLKIFSRQTPKPLIEKKRSSHP